MNRKHLFSALLIFLAIGASAACSSSPSADSEPTDIAVDPDIAFEAPEFAMLKESIIVRNTNNAPGYEMTIDFGDGNVSTVQSGTAVRHAYEKSGQFTISITSVGLNAASRHIEVGALPALSEATRVFSDPANRRIMVVAHRAHTTNRSVPENSLAAIDAAIAAGADMVETDIQRTADGVLCICHDKALPDANGNMVNISATPWNTVRQIVLRDRDGNLTSQHVPSLGEFLLHGRGKIYFNLDKVENLDDPAPVFETVGKLSMLQGVMFYGSAADKAFLFSPEAHVGIWDCSPAQLSGNLWEHYSQTSYIASQSRVTPYPAKALDAGIPVYINLLNVIDNKIPEYEIDPAHLDDMLDQVPRTAYIQTDCPAELVEYLTSAGRR